MVLGSPVIVRRSPTSLSAVPRYSSWMKHPIPHESTAYGGHPFRLPHSRFPTSPGQ